MTRAIPSHCFSEIYGVLIFSGPHEQYYQEMEEESGSDRCKGAWRASRAASRPPVTVHEGACKATIFGKNHSRIHIFLPPPPPLFYLNRFSEDLGVSAALLGSRVYTLLKTGLVWLIKCLLYNVRAYVQMPSTPIKRWAWQHEPVAPALGRQRQGDLWGLPASCLRQF